ncbi:hypothetical protein BGW42_007638 [Actinomortierella wolfii]|nr:hypothetical protein BGW42_007638 [Actinomortierella wolfii]
MAPTVTIIRSSIPQGTTPHGYRTVSTGSLPNCQSDIAALSTDDTQQTTDTPTIKSHQPRVATFKILTHSRNNEPWTSEDDRRLVALKSQGLTWSSIASILKRHRTACSRRYDKLTVPDPLSKTISGDASTHIDPVFAENAKNRERLFNLVNQGISWAKIGQEFGLKANVCQIQWRRLRRQIFDSSNESVTAEKQTTLASPSTTSSIRSLKNLMSVLVPAVQTYGTDQWETISQQVFGGGFSPAWLRHQYVKYEQKRSKWTKQEGQELIDAVQAALGAPITDQNYDLTLPQWEAIASKTGGKRTVEDCRRRWRLHQLAQASAESSARKSHQVETNEKQVSDRYIPWTDEASARLVSLIPACSKSVGEKELIDWLKVEDGMKSFGYTKLQCKARWNRMIRISNLTSTSLPVTATSATSMGTTSLVRVSSQPWDQQEIETLLRGIADQGDRGWTNIQREYLPNRLAKGIQGKWDGIIRKLLRESYVNLTSIEHEAERLYGQVARKELEQIIAKWPCLISKAKEKNSLKEINHKK